MRSLLKRATLKTPAESATFLRLAPTATNADGNTVTSPDYASDAFGLLRLIDSPTNKGRLLWIDHYGTGAGGNLANGANLMNWPGAYTLVSGHQYSSNGPFMQLDNTGHAPLVRWSATENQGNNPNSKGSGPFLDLQAYVAAQFTDGVVANGAATLSSASATFTDADLGAGIMSAQFPANTYILSRQSSTQVTLSANATATTGGVTFVIQRGSVQTNGYIDAFQRFVGRNALVPWTFTTDATQGTITNLLLDQGGDGDNLVLNTKGAGNAASFYSFATRWGYLQKSSGGGLKLLGGTGAAVLILDDSVGGSLKYNGSQVTVGGGSVQVGASTDAINVKGNALGFFNTAASAKATISGSRGGNAALAALLTELAAKGLITDGSSA